MSTVTQPKVYSGTLNPAQNEWIPFEWEEPRVGHQARGEVSIVRPEGTSGDLTAGFWRTHAGAPGANPDGSDSIVYSAPLGDETALVIEGSATVTVSKTGQSCELEPGTIMCHPKGLELTWDVRGPYLKKYWVIWNSPNAAATPRENLQFANINDNPDQWQPYEWTEPADGDQVCGELFFINQRGSTGTLLVCIWRTGVGIAGCEPDGSSTVPYTTPLGDETMLLLEGESHVRDDSTGEEYDFKAGDIIALPTGYHVTWTSKPAYVKKLSVITNAELPD